MHRHALAARDVADDGLAADRIAALGAVDQQVVDALDLDDQVLIAGAAVCAGATPDGCPEPERSPEPRRVT